MKCRFEIVLLAWPVVCWLFSLPVMTHGRIKKAESTVDVVQPVVEVEEIVTRYTPANNGAGPLWCYGSAAIARQGRTTLH